MADLIKQIELTMGVINNLSNDAKAANEPDLMYAANRAWHQLFDARQRLELRAHSRDSAADARPHERKATP